MNTVITWVKRHPLITFFILTYALTWATAPLIGGVIPQIPFLTVVIVLALSEGKQGLKALLRQATHWRVGWQWYLIAPGIVAIINFGAVGLNLLLGAHISPSYGPLPVAYLLEGIFIVMLFGMWEEPGWTGYALPRLRVGRSLLLATLILAGLRTLWHLPLFLSGDIPWSDIVLNVAAQVIISWLYYRTNRSLLIVMLLHFSSNYIYAALVSEPGLFEGGNLIQFAWLEAGLATLIALSLIVFDRQLWFAPASSAQPEIVTASVARV
ncbi:MAG: CPBP family intramembrane metalloprotease [Anaerolineae bacterium]|nr:CPBP family intramembrane metalloprotease [Anaerolineae bacterium]